MEDSSLEAFAPGCNLCPEGKQAKCAILFGEIAALMGMDWREGLLHERDKLVNRRQEAIKQQANRSCEGPWVIREENNMLVCGLESCVIVIGGKSRGYESKRYRRIAGSNSGILQ